jgi:hypothetical protein
MSKGFDYYVPHSYKTFFLTIAVALIAGAFVYAGVRGAGALKQRYGAPIGNLIHGRSCVVRAANTRLPRQPVTFSDVAKNNAIRLKVTADCANANWRDAKLSFHVYDRSGALLRWDNPEFALERQKGSTYGFIQLSLADLAALGKKKLAIKPDLVNASGAWASKSFFSSGPEIAVRFDRRSIAQNLAKVMAHATPAGNACALRFPASQSTSLGYGYKRLATQKVVTLDAQTGCRQLAGKRLVYHVLDGRGHLVAWNAALADGTSVFKPVSGSKANGHAQWQAKLALPVASYKEHAPGTLRFVPDVVAKTGSMVLRGKLKTAAVSVDYRLDKFRHLFQIVPFLMPDVSIGAAPVLYDLYSPTGNPTVFRASEAFFKEPAHTRYDTWRHDLPGIEEGDNWEFALVPYITPAPGTYHMHVGFVYDPYLWYSNVFKLPGATSHALRLRWFILCVIIGVTLFFAFLKYAFASPKWLEKAAFGLAALFLIYLIVIPAVLSGLGWMTLFAMAFIYLVTRYDVRRSAAAMIISGALFGFSMELYWGGLLQTYWYGIILSAAAQALAIAVICLLVRRPSWRVPVVAVWFFVWLCLYAGVDIYLEFFGEAPRLNVLSYAGQGVSVAGEIPSLIGIEQILGILIGLVYVVGLAFSPWLCRLSMRENPRLTTHESNSPRRGVQKG